MLICSGQQKGLLVFDKEEHNKGGEYEITFVKTQKF